VPVSAQAGRRLAEAHPGAVKGLLALAYPLEYLDLANEYAVANGFSPLLLLALVRQESLYDPGAVSFAGAMGLTQVMPATADQIASELNEPGFQYSDLMRPRVSLRFGAHYLGQQIEGFGWNTAAALAAFNGGPGNAAAWLETAGDDPDLMLESIAYAETRAYVELVLESYVLYLYAWGLMPEPALPLP
jgi:soluble lytic murein transglycosylase